MKFSEFLFIKLVSGSKQRYFTAANSSTAD